MVSLIGIHERSYRCLYIKPELETDGNVPIAVSGSLSFGISFGGRTFFDPIDPGLNSLFWPLPFISGSGFESIELSDKISFVFILIYLFFIYYIKYFIRIRRTLQKIEDRKERRRFVMRLQYRLRWALLWLQLVFPVVYQLLRTCKGFQAVRILIEIILVSVLAPEIKMLTSRWTEGQLPKCLLEQPLPFWNLNLVKIVGKLVFVVKLVVKLGGKRFRIVTWPDNQMGNMQLDHKKDSD